MQNIPPDILSVAFSEKALCTRCGTCVGVCPTKAIAIDPDLYPTLDDKLCTQCGLCKETCPGGTLSFADLTEITFGHRNDDDSFDGIVSETQIAHAGDNSFREGGAGGGIVTALLADLLDRGVVDGCIVTRMKASSPWQGEAFVARTREELLESQGSRYMIIPVNEVFQLLSTLEGKYALAALPCQVHGYRLMQKKAPALAAKIHVAIGLFCGGSLEPCVVTDLLRTKGIRTSEIESFEFRGGEWPGSMRAIMKGGTPRPLHYSNYKDGAYNYLISLYMPARCQTCLDGSNLFSDLSVSDAWTKDEDGNYKFKSHSRILVRTPRGAEVVKQAAQSGAIVAQSVSDDPSYRTHKIQTKRKGLNAPLRVDRLRRRGKPAPQYDRPTPEATGKERLFERFASGLLWLGTHKTLRFLLVKFLMSKLAIPLIKLRIYLKRRKYQKKRS